MTAGALSALAKEALEFDRSLRLRGHSVLMEMLTRQGSFREAAPWHSKVFGAEP